jgi:PAP2 superfamily
MKAMHQPCTLWALIATVAIIDVTWATATGMRIVYNPALLALALAIWFVYARLRPGPRLASAAMAVAQLCAALAAVAVFTYLSVMTGIPPVDAQLASIDRGLGLDWRAIFLWVMDHTAIKTVLSVSYWSLKTQIAVLLIFLAVTSRLDRISEFVWLCIVTLITCAMISLALPADSAWRHYGVEHLIDAYHLQHLDDLRSGHMKTLDVSQMYGIITFPSWHATLGLILIYAARGIPILFPLAIALNFGMIAATPTIGGHHFIDVLAGGAIAIIAIAFFRHLQPALDSQASPRPAGAATPSIVWAKVLIPSPQRKRSHERPRFR